MRLNADAERLVSEELLGWNTARQFSIALRGVSDHTKTRYVFTRGGTRTQV